MVNQTWSIQEDQQWQSMGVKKPIVVYDYEDSHWYTDTVLASLTFPTSSSVCIIFFILAGGKRALYFFFLLGILTSNLKQYLSNYIFYWEIGPFSFFHCLALLVG